VRNSKLEAGRSLSTIDPSQVRETIAAEPWIESARALRLPTGTLVIAIVERQAVARWQISESSVTELIDQRGKRFAGATERGGPLPLVRGEIKADDSLPASAIEILDELRRHASLTKDPSRLTLHLPGPETVETEAKPEVDSGYVLQIGEDGPRAILGKHHFTRRVARLAALLDSEESKIRDVRWIDLRFADRAVLRTEPVSG